MGSTDAPVTMIEFSDYPPLSFHPNATKAAEAAECSGEQGKYWEYHNALFDHQNALDNKSIKQYAIDWD